MKLGIKFCITIATIITAMVVACIVVTKKTTVSYESESISETGTMSCIETKTESETITESISETESETITDPTSSSMNQILYTDEKGNLYEILKEYTANDGRELILFQNIKTKTVSLALRKYFYKNYHFVED